MSNLPDDADDATIVRAIIFMGRLLNLRVIAEGVETEAQRDFLEEHGCHEWQGHLLGKAMPREEFDAFIERLGHGSGTGTV